MGFKATKLFDEGRHAISLAHEAKKIATRYTPFASHVHKFHMRRAAEFSQMRNVVWAGSDYEAVMSAA